jgi:hypothetical protein
MCRNLKESRMQDRKSFLRIIPVLTLAAAMSLAGTAVWAQATRTWVSGVGDDINPCSRTAPCKTFAGAISKTAAGGEINVLDSGAFGAVTINKSLTIDGTPFLSGVLASSTTGIIVNATSTDVVILRNLDINGGTAALPGLRGIRFLVGKALYVEDCRIYGFNGNPGRGIDFAPTAASGNVAQLFVKNSDIRENLTVTTGGGIVLTPGVGISVKAELDNVSIVRNNVGLQANPGSAVVARHTTSLANRLDGFNATGNGTASTIFLDNCTSAFNGDNGLQATGAGSVIRMTQCSITGNGLQGVTSAAGGQILSFGTNNNDGNTGLAGVPTPVGQQ